MPRDSLCNKNVTVIGLGVHGGGVGTVCWLLRQGAHVLVSDLQPQEALKSSLRQIDQEYRRLRRRRMRPIYPRFHLGVRQHTIAEIRDTDFVVVNPGVPRSSPVFRWARQYSIPVRIADTSLFLERFGGRVIGITGTRGKTTTATVLGKLLRRGFPRTIVAGNLRITPLKYLKPSRPPSDDASKIAVLELSSWQVEGLRDIRKSPWIAIITNVFPDHLNRYRSMKYYIRSKSLLLKYQRQNDHAILNYDCPETRAMVCLVRGNVWWVSARRLPERYAGIHCVRGWAVVNRRRGAGQRLFPLKTIPLIGEHQRMNVLAAALAALLAGVPPLSIRSAVQRIQPIHGRLEHIRSVNGITYINDTAATSPEATIAALNALKNSSRHPRIILIAGGADKGLEYSRLASSISSWVKECILLSGDASTKLHRALESVGFTRFGDHGEALYAQSLREALQRARKSAKGGDTILLSPAAASFGMFRHAYHRGERFNAIVKRL